MRRSIAVALSLLLGSTLFAQDDARAGRFDPVWSETEPEQFAQFVRSTLAKQPDFDEVLAALRAGPRYSAEAPKGWVRGSMRGLDGVERPYLLFVPEEYDPARAHRLLVHLHGGVSRPTAPTHEQLASAKRYWGEHARQHGYLHLVPAGQRGAEWWSEVGSRNLLAQIDRVSCTYHVDPNRIFATGFSDGASGCFYLGIAQPTRFAGFLPLSGHVAVAGVGGLQVHLHNLRNKPIYVINTDQDSLYPAKGVLPFIEVMKRIGVPVEYEEIRGFGHDSSYVPEARPRLWAWMQKQERAPHPKELHWQGSAEAPGRVHWLDVLGIREFEEKSLFSDPNPEIRPSRVRLGVQIDTAFAGPGVRLTVVVEDSVAAECGLRKGDVLLAMNGTKLLSLRDLRALLGKVAFGEEFTLRVAREGKELSSKGRFPEVQPRPAFARNRPFGTVRAVRDGNRIRLSCQGVSKLALLLSPDVFDFEAPIVVEVNGEVRFEKKVARDARFMIEQAHRDKDRAMLYAARLELSL